MDKDTTNTNEQPKKKPKGSLLLAYQVKNKHCLVIGAGDVALSRILHLIRAEAKITVIAGERKPVHPDILSLHENGELYGFHNRDYRSCDLELYRLERNRLLITNLDDISPQHYSQISQQVQNEIFANVCCCIDNYELSSKIYYQCKYLGLPVNIADKPPLCDFYFGSMFNQDNLQIMVSTNGMSPRLSKLIKDQIAKEFKDIDLNRAVENLGLVRSRLRETLVIDDDEKSIDIRMNWIKTLTDFFSIKQWSQLNFVPLEELKLGLTIDALKDKISNMEATNKAADDQNSLAPRTIDSVNNKQPNDDDTTDIAHSNDDFDKHNGISALYLATKYRYVDRIISYFPDFPPHDYNEFTQLLR